MAIQLLSNLNYPIGNIINQELQNANSAKIAVAFLKYSGVQVIEQADLTPYYVPTSIRELPMFCSMYC